MQVKSKSRQLYSTHATGDEKEPVLPNVGEFDSVDAEENIEYNRE